MNMILHDIDRSLDLCSTSLAFVTIQHKSDTLMEMYHYSNFNSSQTLTVSTGFFRPVFFFFFCPFTL